MSSAGHSYGILAECFHLTHSWYSGEKIPFIGHDLQKPEWEAVARILVYG